MSKFDFRLVTIDCWDTILINDGVWDDHINEVFVKYLRLNYCHVEIERILKIIQLEDLNFSNNLSINSVTIPCEDRIIYILKKANINFDKSLVHKLKTKIDCLILAPPPELDSDVKQFLMEIKSFGLRTCLICNTGWFSCDAITKALNYYNLIAYFDKMIFSDRFGKAKPSKFIFHEAINYFKLKPSNTIHIGDSFEKDYNGAKRAGIKPILYTGITHQNEDYNCSYSNYHNILDFIKMNIHS